MSNTHKCKHKGKEKRGLAKRALNSPKSQHDDVEEYGHIKHRKIKQNKKDFFNQIKEIKEIIMNKCKMREDLFDFGYCISVGDGVYCGDDELEYKWDEDDNFSVLLDGKFQRADSIDFEFIDK